MSTSKEFVEYILDQSRDPKTSVRAMFGEYALYYDRKVVGLICNDTIYIKVTKGTEELLKDNERGPAYPGARNTFILNESQIEENGFFIKILQTVFDDLPQPKHSKKQKSYKK